MHALIRRRAAAVSSPGPAALLAALLVALLAACGDGGSSSGDGGTGGDAASADPTLSVAGTVVDFTTGVAIAGTATITTEGLNPTPPPRISTVGADFTIEGVPAYSVFFVLSGSPPTYRSTYNVATVVEAADVADVSAEAITEDAVTALAGTFGVTPAAGTGILIVKIVDGVGAPRAGFDASTLAVAGAPAADGPYYLGADKTADALLDVTSSSGYAVWYGVPPGTATLEPAPASTVAVIAAASPIAANVVTLAEAEVADVPPPLPTGVSFSGDLVPMFERRGCAACHSGNGPGRDRGGLTLNGGVPKIYDEVRNEVSPIDGIPRVNLVTPEESLMLRLPGLPVDRHPNTTFASDVDPDYLLLLVWIREGALNN